MKAPKAIARPRNWQDFESLCKKLWGEIWNCPEIKKYGRNGQAQNGVDIYGIPFGEDEYYGIQCKGKDAYTHKRLSLKEIDQELQKATLFQPPLKKLYLATTASKDVTLERYIRNKNLEHKKQQLFEVHLFCWEDIVDLIEENQNTYQYYVNSIHFKTAQSVEITFQGDSKQLVITPKFRETITRYILNTRYKDIDSNNPYMHLPKALQRLYATHQNLSKIKYTQRGTTQINESFYGFHLKITNTGDTPLEEYQLLFEFEGDILDISDTNEITPILWGLKVVSQLHYSTHLYKDSLKGKVKPYQNILVGDDTFVSDEIFIKPSHKESQILIHWKLLSKNFKDKGYLTLTVKPQVITQFDEVITEDPAKVRIENSEVEDYITDKIE